jgi:hypothetical protein
MIHCPTAAFSRRARVSAPGVLLLLAMLFAGCGITLSQGHSQTEFFKRLVIVGPLVTGSELRIGLNYAQPYPVPLDVRCDLLNLAKATPTPKPTKAAGPKPTATPVHVPAAEPTPRNRISIVLQESVGPNKEGTTADESTPVLGSLTSRFTAPDRPGRYAVRCYTPADDNNQISRSFSIEAAEPTPD